MSGTWIFLPQSGGSSLYWGDPVAAVGDLPVSGSTGEVRLVEADGALYWWNGAAWVQFTEPPAVYTADRALISDGAGAISVSSTTSTEIGYVSGVTSSIQTQLDTKAPTNAPTFTGTVTMSGGGLRLANLTTVQRDALTAAEGMMIFNTDTTRFQGYFNGAWGDLHGWGS